MRHYKTLDLNLIFRYNAELYALSLTSPVWCPHVVYNRGRGIKNVFQYHEIQKPKVTENSGNIGQFENLVIFHQLFLGIKTEYDGPKAMVWWHDTVLFSQFFPHVSSNIRLLSELVAFKFFSLAGNFCPRSARPAWSTCCSPTWYPEMWDTLRAVRDPLCHRHQPGWTRTLLLLE